MDNCPWRTRGGPRQPSTSRHQGQTGKQSRTGQMDRKLTSEIVSSVWPAYSDFVGEGSLLELIDEVEAGGASDVDVERELGGDKLDLARALKILREAVLLVSAGLALYQQ